MLIIQFMEKIDMFLHIKLQLILIIIFGDIAIFSLAWKILEFMIVAVYLIPMTWYFQE